MDHDWSLPIPVFDSSRRFRWCGTLASIRRCQTSRLSCPVAELELLWQLEVQLYSGTLEASFQGITNGDIDLWSVESAISWVLLPLSRDKLVQSVRQHRFSLIPGSFVSKLVGRSRRELQLESKAEEAIHMLQEVKKLRHFVLDLHNAVQPRVGSICRLRLPDLLCRKRARHPAEIDALA